MKHRLSQNGMAVAVWVFIVMDGRGIGDEEVNSEPGASVYDGFSISAGSDESGFAKGSGLN